MNVINVHEAKTHLSRLLRRVAGGEEIIIARAGRPLARLVPFDEVPPRRTPGTSSDRIVLHDEFDDPLPDEILEDFER